MFAAIGKALAVGGIATLAYATTAVTISVPAAAQFSKGYSLDEDADFRLSTCSPQYHDGGRLRRAPRRAADP